MQYDIVLLLYPILSLDIWAMRKDLKSFLLHLHLTTYSAEQHMNWYC